MFKPAATQGLIVMAGLICPEPECGEKFRFVRGYLSHVRLIHEGCLIRCNLGRCATIGRTFRKFTTFRDHVYANQGQAVATSTFFSRVTSVFFVDPCITFHSSVEPAHNTSDMDPLNEGRAAASEYEDENRLLDEDEIVCLS